MRSLDFLKQRLEPKDVPELDSVDPRYMEVADLAHRSDWSKLSERVEVLLDEGQYDVRLLGFYLFSRFASDGPSQLESIFGALLGMLEHSSDVIAPKRRRNLHIDKSVTWLCQEIMDSVDYHQGKNGELWQRWASKTSQKSVAAAIDCVEKLHKRLTDPAFTGSEQGLSRVLRWMRDFSKTLLAQQDPPAMKKENTEAASPAAQPSKSKAGAGERSGKVAAGQTLHLQVSSHFVELDRKLKAFSKLIEAGQFEKAALVSDDLTELLEHFDPRKYFPEFFAVFSRLMSEHVQQLEEHWDKRDSVQWKTLKQFYQVDLDAFSGNKRE